MTGAGQLEAAFAFEVHPQQYSKFAGGAIAVNVDLGDALDRTFDRSNIASAPAVNFNVDAGDVNRAHPIRDAAKALAFESGPHATRVEEMAKRLGLAMDNRSKPALMMVSVHGGPTAGRKRVLLWTFPQQEVFSLSISSGTAELDLLDAFNRESSLRKAALIEGTNDKGGMLTARVLDFQASANDRTVADLWIVKFLDARLQMSDAEGTNLVARCLKEAHTKKRGDADAQEQINAAISGLRTSVGHRWSLNTVAKTYLPGETGDIFLAAARPEERAASFDLDVSRFERMVQYRRFTLENGVIVSAPFGSIGDDGEVQVEEKDGHRFLRASGVIEEERVRTRG